MTVDKALYFSRPEDYFTVEETAKHLSRSPAAVYAMIRHGRLTFVRVARTTFVYVPDVEKVAVKAKATAPSHS